MDCEFGGHQLGPNPAICNVSVVVTSLGRGPAIWTVGVKWSSLRSRPCHMECECSGHQLGPSPAIWIDS